MGIRFGPWTLDKIVYETTHCYRDKLPIILNTEEDFPRMMKDVVSPCFICNYINLEKLWYMNWEYVLKDSLSTSKLVLYSWLFLYSLWICTTNKSTFIFRMGQNISLLKRHNHHHGLGHSRLLILTHLTGTILHEFLLFKGLLLTQKHFCLYPLQTSGKKWKGPWQNWKGISFKDLKLRFSREPPEADSPQN